jgi:Ca2+-binding EF-hand superfamily protein
MKSWCVLTALVFAVLGTARGEAPDAATPTTPAVANADASPESPTTASAASTDSSTATAAPATADVQEIVLLAPAGPIVVRLHIQLQGQPYQSTWGDYLWERFSELDTNGDGSLDNDEYYRGNWEGGFVQRRDAAGRTIAERMTFLEIDVNPQDDAVSFTEFAERLADGCFSLSSNAAQQSSAGEDALVGRIDGNRDGRLTRDEISTALALLYKFDINEDELLTDIELRADGNPFAGRFLARPGMQQNGQASTALAPIPGASLGSVAHAVFLHYDRPHSSPGEASEPNAKSDGQLSPEELRIASDTFRSADSDQSGGLNEAEFAAWLASRPPDVELAANLDAEVAVDKRLQLITPSGNVAEAAGAAPTKPRAGEVVASSAKAGTITVRATQCEIVLSASGVSKFDQQRSNFEMTFKQIDADQNGYIDEQEARNRLGGRSQFTRMDADRDGKLFVEEYLRYQESEHKLTSRRVAATVSDQGSRLLEIVDANSNSQLSIRELRALPALLASWDASADGDVAADELPRRYQVQIAPGVGGQTLGLAVPVAFNGMVQTEVKLSGKGPEWYQRMDRNGDGDLSRREFLGSRAEFQRLDADGDGLIDLAEAEKAK